MTRKASEKKLLTDTPIAQARLLRVLNIISMLKENHWPVTTLSRKVDMTQRTLYRYLRLIESVGFPLEKDFQNRYFIVANDAEQSAHFTIEELAVLKKLISTGMSRNPLKGQLLRKLSLNSKLESLPDLFIKVRNGRMVEQLSEAMQQKKQVCLHNYHSAHSKEIKDRLVEPFVFGDDYATVSALDTNDKKCKQFKLERISEIFVMDIPFRFEHLHHVSPADPFGISGNKVTWITLKLSLRAYLLMREEFPQTIPFLEKTEEHCVFHGPVQNFEGIGRFVLGLPNEIVIVQPQEFKAFIKDRIKGQTLIL
jgi:proteasome accessory factor C